MPDKNHQFLLTKVIATYGPSTGSIEKLVALIEAGARVFRINFSHGTLDEFGEAIAKIREASERCGRDVGVLGDLSGPKFRLGKVIDDGLQLEPDQEIEFVAEKLVAGEDSSEKTIRFSVNDPIILDHPAPGERILLNDGAIELECIARPDPDSGRGLRLKVIVGGPISSAKGVNLPDTQLPMPALTEWDEACVEFAVEKGFDFLALSFVTNGEDVRILKNRLRNLGARPRSPKRREAGPGPQYSSYGGGSRSFIPVIAKVEKPQALAHIDEIVDESDVIMVARGDLGVEMDFAQVPVLQKKIIQVCHNHGKPVIVATQMLQSMIDAPSPTRAEASDVANAILTGADCVMLSGETAVGKYPVESVRTMRRIAWHTNHYRMDQEPSFSPPRKPRESRYRTAALAHGVGVVASDLGARLIVMWSSQGGGASYISQLRMSIPVLALSCNHAALRRMSLLYGIVPRYLTEPDSGNAFIREVDRMLLEKNWAQTGDSIVLVLGEPFGQEGLTNEIRIHYVGDYLSKNLIE